MSEVVAIAVGDEVRVHLHPAGSWKCFSEGVVRQSRGGITITDPTALREAACECYQTVHDVFVRLLPYTAKKD
jgi:hypothetical protein